MELLQDPPPIDLYDEAWPILTGRCQCGPAKLAPGSLVTDSILGAGCQVAGTVEHSVLFEKVRVGRGSQITYSLVLPGATVGRNCNIEGAIVDSDCEVPTGTVIGDPVGERGIQSSSRGQIKLVTAESLATPGGRVGTRLSVA